MLAATNCVFWGDSPDEVHDSIGTMAVITHSNLQGGWPGEGNIDSDPKFAWCSDYHLLPDSPCIDAGTNEPEGGLPAYDLDGTPRPLDGDADELALADIGAFEFDPITPVIALGEDQFEFAAPLGGTDLLMQTAEIRNVGGGFLDWQVIEDCSWLTVSPASGRSSGEVDPVTLTVDATGLDHGCYEGIVAITDPTATNSPREIHVTLRVYATLHVPSEYTTIQAAIDACEPYDLVLVADGVHTGSGNQNLSFRGKEITVQSENGASQCIIDCGGSGRGFCFDQGESSEAILEGFTVRNGFVDDTDPIGPVGGGICCIDSDPTMRDCIITNNVVSDTAAWGGGVYLEDSCSLMSGCTISNNTAEEGNARGGGVGCDGGYPVLVECRIQGNSAARHGGGMALSYGDATCTRCVFGGNSSVEGGGLYETLSSALKLERCVIAGNSASRGGGIRFSSGNGRQLISNCVIVGNSGSQGAGLYYGSGWVSPVPKCPILRNCTIAFNSSSVGGGVYSQSEGSASLANCVLWGNTPQQIAAAQYYTLPTVTYSCVAGGYDGEGNINADPLFVDVDGPDDDATTWEDNNYQLSAGSPCIDAGSNLAVPSDEWDLDGDGDTNERIPFDLAGFARFIDDPMMTDTGLADPPAYPAIVDMGAYEFQALPQDCNGNGISDDEDIAGGFSKDCDDNGIPDECELCGDLNDDGSVDYDDYTIFLAAFGGVVDGVPPEDACCDADNSGDIGMADFAAWLACYRDFIGDQLADPPTAPTDPTDEGFSGRKKGDTRTDRKGHRTPLRTADMAEVEAGRTP